MGYINGRGATNRDQLVTYERMIDRRDNFRNFMRIKENRNYLTLEEKFEGVQLISKEDINVEWVDESKVNLGNANSCYSYLYTIE